MGDPPNPPPPSYLEVRDRQKQLWTPVGVACLSFSVPSGGCQAERRELPCTLLAGQRGLEHVRERPPGLLLPRSAFQSLRRYTGFCKPAFVSCSPPPPLKIFLLIDNHQEIMKSQDLGYCSKGIALLGEHVLCVTL